MEITFSEALRTLSPNAAFRVANEARPPADYLFATFLRERADYDYTATAGSMTVRTTMAGPVGMDSPYPPGGLVEESTFSEGTAKIAIHTYLPEYALRKLQQRFMHLQLRNQLTVEGVQREALNFEDKVIVQAMLDTAEYLRGLALATGTLNWAFGQKNLAVNYGIPASNMLPERTGTAGYGGTASVFWNDHRTARRVLRYQVEAGIAHPDTIDMIIYNPANALNVIDQTGNTFTLQRKVGNTEQGSTDTRDTVQLIAYGAEGEVFNPANPAVTTLVPFMPRGRVLWLGRAGQTGYQVGQGSTKRADTSAELGYTHLAPTVEGGGVPGRWARLYTPEGQPWSLHGQGAMNVLPVIERPTLIAVQRTEMV